MRAAFACAVAGALALAFGFSAASARPWTGNPKALAGDYLLITDNRLDGDAVIVWWLAPPIIDAKTQRDAADALDKYFVVGVAHERIIGNAVGYDADDVPSAVDSNGAAMKLVKKQDMPANVSAMLGGLQTSLSSALGATGQHIQWVTFAGNAHACGKGGHIAVTYADQTYTYDTPIPGCPKP